MSKDPKLVLLAEDDEDLRFLCLLQLKRLGYQAHVAKDGVEAITLSRKNNYDLILMDLMMPEMDGCHAAQAIRADEDSRNKEHAPIIAITALHQENFCGSMNIKLDDYLFKPVLMNELRDTLAKWTVSA